MDQIIRNVGIAILIAVLAAAIILAVIVIETRTMERISLKDRVATLEHLMREKSRPMIHIERATVYNTDGEVVIEENATKTPRHEGKQDG